MTDKCETCNGYGYVATGPDKGERCPDCTPKFGGCECYAGESYTGSPRRFKGYVVIRCDRCKKRDELWPEMVAMLGMVHDEYVAFYGNVERLSGHPLGDNLKRIIPMLDALLSRCKEVSDG